MARSSVAGFRGRFAFLALLALTGSASAAVTLSSFPPNPGVLPGGGWQFTPGTTFANPPPARAWVNGVYGGVPAAVVTDTFSLKGPAGALSAAVTSSATAPSIAAALARVAGRAHLGLSLGMAAYDLLSGVGVRQGAVGAEIDPGTDQSPQNCTGYSVFGGPQPVHCLPAQAACDLRASYVLANQPGLKRGRLTGSGSTLRCVQETSLDGGLYWNAYSSDLFGNPVTKTGVTMCSPVVDSLTGESYVPGTYSDGKCITGRYTAATDAQVISRVSPVVQADPSAAAKAAADAGASIESSPYSVSGPASQSGIPTTTTTTDPAGTTTTTTTPTYNYSYNGDKITYTTTTVTNTCTGAGACSTNNAYKTTTTTTGSPAPQDPADPCTADPSRLGCLKLGDPPDDKIPRNNKTVTFTPEALGLGGSCPAPVQLPHGQQISYQTVCDGVVQARPLIIAMGFLMAGGIMLGALRPQ